MTVWKILGCVTLVACFTSSSYANEMAPHRAIYDITFGQSKPQSNVTAGAGKWVLEVKRETCKEYQVMYRFVSRLNSVASGDILLDTQGKYVENLADENFEFINTVLQDNEIREDVEGIASRKENTIEVKLKKPESVTLTIDGNVLFPVQHSLKLVSAAKAGETVENNLVYEGIEGAKEAMLASALILPEKGVEKGGDLIYQVLEDNELRRWPVSVSYFNLETKGDGEPEWQTSFLLYENGVARDFTFDYGEFSLKGTLEKLEMLQPATCD